MFLRFNYIFAVCSSPVFNAYFRVTNFLPRLFGLDRYISELACSQATVLKIITLFLLTYKLIFHVLQMEPRPPILTALTLVAFTAAARGHLLKGRVSRDGYFFKL
jgi:hypothetical protein